LKNGRSNISGVSQRFQQRRYEPNNIGILILWEKEGLEAVGAADAALITV
jgi:hypothetical protein